MTMTLYIWVARDGRLHCFIPEQRYSYIVQSWSVFFNALGTTNIDDYARIEVRYWL